MIRLTIVACAFVLLGACSTVPYEADRETTRVAEDRYSLCLTHSAARLDDGQSEAATIGKAVAGACYPQFTQIQIADGDAAREEFQRTNSPAIAALMHKQDEVQQALMAKQAVLVHRQRAAEIAADTASAAVVNASAAAN